MKTPIILTKLILLLLFASACQASGEQVEPGDSPPIPNENDPLINAFEATCTANDLDNYNFCQNGTCTPVDNAVAVSTTPLLDWEALSCLPDAYKVSVFSFLNAKVFEGFASFDQNTNSWNTSLLVNPALEPGGHYSWSVIPILNGQDYWKSNAQEFFTGPICSGQGLLAPDLVSPADNSTVAVSWAVTVVSYAPECNPDFFIREMDTSPSFNGPNLMAGPGVAPNIAQITAGVLQDCTKYYWHAKASSQGNESPWSSTFSFGTDFDGNCAGPPAASESEPVVDNAMFYLGACLPNDLNIMIMMEHEALASVQMNYRLMQMNGEMEGEWQMMAMEMEGEYYQTMLYSADIPAADAYLPAYLQMQFAGLDENDNVVLITDLFGDMVSLYACVGGQPVPSATATPKATAEPKATATATPTATERPRVTPTPTDETDDPRR